MKCTVLSLFLLAVFCCHGANSSAIPMWEFLGRGEKMSRLFNMFIKLVQDYCGTSTMPDCNKVLLVYGLTNLAKMEDDSLDMMDPYQRDARNIIWESMMKGSYKVPSNKDQDDYFVTGAENGDSGTSGNHLGTREEATSNVNDYVTPNRYVFGPMVVRVLPDGSPVPGDSQRPLPRDEDAEEYGLLRSPAALSAASTYRQQLQAPQNPILRNRRQPYLSSGVLRIL